jgi:transcriptional regulator with XRE-family HTH domain
MTTKQRELTPAEVEVLGRIESRLAERSMSWAELARRVGRSTQLGAQWSGRRSFPPERIMTKIAEVLEVPRSWLLSGTENEDEVRARTVRQASVLRLMLDMTPDQEAALLAAAEGISAHMKQKK